MPAADVVTVEIECFEQNTFCTSYRDGKYSEYAARVERCIQQRLAADGLACCIERNRGPGRGFVPYFRCGGWYVCEVDPELKVRYPRHGAFEVALSWATPMGDESVEVWSKLDSRRWPVPEKLAASVSDLAGAWPQRPGGAWEEALRRTGARRRGARGLRLAAGLLPGAPPGAPPSAAPPRRHAPGRQPGPLSGPAAYGFRTPSSATPSSSSRAASAECSATLSSAGSSQDGGWSAGSAVAHTRRLRVGPPRCSSAGSEQGARRRRDLQRERELDQQLRREEAEARSRQPPAAAAEEAALAAPSSSAQAAAPARASSAPAAAKRAEAAAAGSPAPPRSTARPPPASEAAWAPAAPSGAKRDDGSAGRPPAERGARCAGEAPLAMESSSALAGGGGGAAAGAPGEPGEGRPEDEEESVELDCEDDEDGAADLWLTGEHCGRKPPPPAPAPQIGGQGGQVRAVHAPRLRTCALAAIAATRMRRALGVPAKKSKDADAPLTGPGGAGRWSSPWAPLPPGAWRLWAPRGSAAHGAAATDGAPAAAPEADPARDGNDPQLKSPLLKALGLEGQSAAETQRRLDEVARSSRGQGGLSVWRQPGCDLVAALAAPLLDAALPLLGATDEAAEAFASEEHQSPLEEWLPRVTADLARLVGAVCDGEGLGDAGSEPGAEAQRRQEERPFRPQEVEGASRLLGEALAERAWRPPSGRGRAGAERRRTAAAGRGRLAGPLARFVPRPIVTWGAVRSQLVSAASFAGCGGRQGLADSWDESIDRMLKDEVVAEGADWLDDSADAQQVLRSAARKLLADLVSETAAEILWVCS